MDHPRDPFNFIRGTNVPIILSKDSWTRPFVFSFYVIYISSILILILFSFCDLHGTGFCSNVSRVKLHHHPAFVVFFPVLNWMHLYRLHCSLPVIGFVFFIHSLFF